MLALNLFIESVHCCHGFWRRKSVVFLMPNPFLGPASVAWAPRAGPNVAWLLVTKNVSFRWFFQCFRVLGLLGPMLAQHGLQEAYKSL